MQIIDPFYFSASPSLFESVIWSLICVYRIYAFLSFLQNTHGFRRWIFCYSPLQKLAFLFLLSPWSAPSSLLLSFFTGLISEETPPQSQCPCTEGAHGPLRAPSAAHLSPVRIVPQLLAGGAGSRAQPLAVVLKSSTYHEAAGLTEVPPSCSLSG